MFQSLARHDHIFVTGPHRSGTTIAARMIAADTGHQLVLEDEFDFANLPQLAAHIQCDAGPAVYQCPFLAAVIHELGRLIEVDMKRSLVVFMHRWRRDIEASEARAPVDFGAVAALERERYHSRDRRHISDIKYDAWLQQCLHIPHAMDLAYDSLRRHPLWLDDRSGLGFEHRIKRPQLAGPFRATLHRLHAQQAFD